MAIGLFALQIMSSLCTHHFFYRAASTGVLLRGGLITAIYERSLKLSSRARATLTNGKLVNHISTDVSRIDFCCSYMQLGLTAPVQMIVCLIILLTNLGPSALAGYAFFVLATPLQTVAMKQFIKIRHKSMAWTDKRAKLLQELLGSMKIIKYFAWEIPYLQRIAELRGQEMAYASTPSCSHDEFLTFYQLHPDVAHHPVSEQRCGHLAACVGQCPCLRRVLGYWALPRPRQHILLSDVVQPPPPAAHVFP